MFPFARLTLVFALFVAMAGSGFAHRFATGGAQEALNAYLSAGGSYQDICGDGDTGRHEAGQTCDACRLVDSVALPPFSGTCAVPDGPMRAKGPAFAALPPHSVAVDPSRPVRAPPAV